MADVLGRIVDRKRTEVAARLKGKPVAAAPTSRSLCSALARPGARFILEAKRASPSGHRSNVGVAEAVAAYAPVADAISILTDGPDFGGSLDDLQIARARFDGPILAKDFIIDPAQVSEARAHGADAVLVMLSVLADGEAQAVMDEARRLRMDAIVEVHDQAELDRALALGAAIIGINNRDLKTLRTDLSVTERLAASVPRDVVLVSESGIAGRADIERLSGHVDAFLVGSSLMASDDVGVAARALVHGRTKLCGLTREDDVACIARSGAIYAGLILVPETPRALRAGRAAELAAAAVGHGLKTVGVFRDAPIEAVAAATRALQLDAVQLHGREDQAYLTELRRKVPDTAELWAVCAVSEAAPPGRNGADRILFDTCRNGQSGGTGSVFDWRLLAGRADLPSAFLAGGIGPGNARAASRMGAYGLDVGSGVESAPGSKDHDKVAALFEALRPASRAEA